MEVLCTALALLTVRHLAAGVRPVPTVAVVAPVRQHRLGVGAGVKILVRDPQERMAEGSPGVDEGVVDVQEHTADGGPVTPAHPGIGRLCL
ncbi:hypothetical protein GCM10025876_06420 [Demequina litorisediminis]|uniref:Secreted protein n=1 Tax=Demequina litorisediminis TaxID=1849022 RepID=A0ABQ6IBF7_9MICO|nr:hypothetical protein GCM10025876_06420 [Demequina litorisediminis]